MKRVAASRRRSQSVLWRLSAGCLLLTLGACANAPAREPLTRQLPAEPAFAREVNVPDPREGEPEILVAQRERQGRKQANTVIRKFRDWYAGVRQSYGAKE